MCKNTQVEPCTHLWDVHNHTCRTHGCKWMVIWRQCVLFPSHINITMEMYSQLHPSSSEFRPFVSNKAEKLEHSLPDLLLSKPGQGSSSGFSWLSLTQNDAACSYSQPETHKPEWEWGSACNILPGCVHVPCSQKGVPLHYGRTRVCKNRKPSLAVSESVASESVSVANESVFMETVEPRSSPVCPKSFLERFKSISSCSEGKQLLITLSLCLHCRNVFIHSPFRWWFPLWNSLWLCLPFSDSQLQTVVRASSCHFKFLQGIWDGWLWVPCKGVAWSKESWLLPPAQESYKLKSLWATLVRQGGPFKLYDRRMFGNPPANASLAFMENRAHKKNTSEAGKASQLLSMDEM